jgi:hypothetical protein
LKLNEWVEEQIEVPSHEINPHTGEVKKSTKVETVKSIYIDPPKQKLRCSDHYFESIDIHRYLFACKKCSFTRQVFPTTYRYEDGKLINKETGRVV